MACSVAALAVPARAQEGPRPNLALTRTRVVLDERPFSSSLTIVNTGTAPGTFRIELTNKRMSEAGKLVTVQEPGPDDRFADGFLRVSPRRIVLQPGESQLVRILARIPPDLAPGEYRSHLRVALLPPDDAAAPEATPSEDEQLRISLQSEIGFNIPVIVRHGELAASVTTSDLQLARDEDGVPRLSFSMHRSGSRSVYGDLEVVFTSPAGEECVVKKMGGIAIYTPNPSRRFDFALDLPEGMSVAQGRLTLTYRDGETPGKPLLAGGQLILE